MSRNERTRQSDDYPNRQTNLHDSFSFPTITKITSNRTKNSVEYKKHGLQLA